MIWSNWWFVMKKLKKEDKRERHPAAENRPVLPRADTASSPPQPAYRAPAPSGALVVDSTPPPSLRRPVWSSPRASLAALSDAASPKPIIETVELDGPLSGRPKQWMAALSDAGFSRARLLSDALELELDEATDLEGRPYQFIGLWLTPRHITLTYSCRSDCHAARRKLEAARLLLLVLSALPGSKLAGPLGAFLASSLQDALLLSSADLETLSARNAELSEQMRRKNHLIEQLEAQREADAKRLLADAQALERQSRRIEELGRLPDAALDEEVMEWLRAHDGQISLREFSSAHPVPPARVQECLDRLSKGGHISRIVIK